MKKRIAFALCAVMALSLSAAAFAAKPVDAAQTPAEDPQPGCTLQIDGKDAGVRACVMVPLRAVAEKLGFQVTWNGDGTILLDDGSMHSTVTVGKELYQVTTSSPDMAGMSAPFSLGVPPYVVSGVTYVPLGLFDALLGSQEGAVTMKNGVIHLNTNPLNKDSNTQIPNPFAEHETLEQAAQAAGFKLTAPDAANGSDSRVFRTMEDKLLEIVYHKEQEETARIRKAPGSDDISGDYTVYPQASEVSVKGNPVTMSGSDDKVSLAVWTDSGYTYAVSVAGGISPSGMTALVSAIH